MVAYLLLMPWAWTNPILVMKEFAGTVLTRPYKGAVLQVKILAEGFEYDGQVYPSLSAVAKAITGTHCNGFLFFRGCLNQGAHP